MNEGPFDSVPLMNKERDKAWEQLIKRKDVAKMFTDTKFGFPINGGFYDLWCIAWANAWDKGFHDGWTNGMDHAAKKCAEIADTAEPYKSADLIRKHFGVEEMRRATRKEKITNPGVYWVPDTKGEKKE